MSNELKDLQHLKCAECKRSFISLENFRKHACEQESASYICEDCGRTFKRLFYFQRHRTWHEFETQNLVCEQCGNVFQKKDKYDNHINICELSLHFQCHFCNEENTKELLLEHLNKHHGIQIETEQKVFKTFGEFQLWKCKYEKETKMCYTKKINYIEKDGSKFYYFQCHLTLHPKVSHTKSGESNVIIEWCPSEIKANKTKKGEVLVSFTKTHVGHNINSMRQQLTSEEKEEIVKRIIEGIPCETLLNELSVAVATTKKEAMTYVGITSEDIENIVKEYNLQDYIDVEEIKKIAVEKVSKTKGRKPSLPYESLQSWVHGKATSDCVKFFKGENTTSSKYPHLGIDTFFLLIMTKAQIDLLKTFGEKFLCVDRHNGENFELVSILVLDELSQCLPCAFLFTDKCDEEVLKVLFTEVNNVVGILNNKIFMSGIGTFVSSNWDQVMGTSEKKLLCSWDVLRDWKFNMYMIKNKEKQYNVYKALKRLLEETDIDAFSSMFELILSDLYEDTETSDFASYIDDNYSQTQSSWGCCFRSNNGIKVSFQLERVHTNLLNILQAKSTGKLVKALDAILNYLRSKIYDRLVLLSKGKVSSKLSEVRNRHKFAEKFNYKVTNNGDYWSVVSAKKEQNKVVVGDKECDCQLKCNICNVCAHAYTCTCLDSTVRLNMCRHIHSVCINEASGNIIFSEDSTMEMQEKQYWFFQEHLKEKRSSHVSSCIQGEEIVIVDPTNPSEDTAVSFEPMMYEEETEISIVEHDPNQTIEIVYENDISQQEVSNFEVTIPAEESIDFKKAELENVFKTILKNVRNEEQLDKIKNALVPFTVVSQNQDDSKKRTLQEANLQTHDVNNIVFQYYPGFLKKPRS